MLLVIDEGNTNIVFAVFEADQLLGRWRLSTDPRRTSDEYIVMLSQLFELSDIDPSGIKDCILSSVVPQSSFALMQLCSEMCENEPLIIGDPAVHLGLRICLERPQEVGADRLVNAVSAFHRYGGNVMVIDFGTATTFDVIGENGEYLGGVIAPGIQLSMDALHQAAAKLPKVDLIPTEKVIGTSTVLAMQSGIYWGYIGMIEGLASRICEEYGKTMRIIATGGLALLFARGTAAIEYLDPDLTIQGLKLIYDINRQDKSRQI